MLELYTVYDCIYFALLQNILQFVESSIQKSLKMETNKYSNMKFRDVPNGTSMNLFGI
jgi:hypothetical protein